MKLGFGVKQFGEMTFFVFDGSIVNVEDVQQMHLFDVDGDCCIQVNYKGDGFSTHNPVGEDDGMQFVLGEVDTPTEAMVREMNTPREAS